MNAQSNTARTAVQAELCLLEAGVVWEAFLMVESVSSPSGMTTEPLSRVFASSGEAMEAAEKLAQMRPEVMGCSVKRVEVAHGL